MALDGFNALLFVPSALEVLAKKTKKKNDSTLPFTPHSPIINSDNFLVLH